MAGRDGRTILSVFVEVGARRTFAAVLDWPGWLRAGRDEEAALTAILEYRDRYAAVAARARLELPADVGFDVIARASGDATTDFGAPNAEAPGDRAAWRATEAARAADLLAAAWAALDDTAAAAPPVLRKGPRGGGRDRDAMLDHVLGAEAAYARKLGVRLTAAPYDDPERIGRQRAAILALVGAPALALTPSDPAWPRRYAVRRMAWHVLDHAWEMADRAAPDGG